MKKNGNSFVKNYRQFFRSLCIFWLLLPVYCWAASWSDVAKTDWYTGHEADNRYIISTSEQLAGLALLVTNGNTFEGKTIVLDNDIDLSGKEWIPIGANDEKWVPYTGNFDAQNHEVKGLTISNEDAAGFFSVLDESGTISNLTLTGNISGSKAVAGLVILNAGNITNCSCNINIEASDANMAGGITAANGGLISNCCNQGNIHVTSATAIGGIAGMSNTDSEFNVNSKIVNCYNTGDISGSAYYIGGIAGSATIDGPSVKSEIINCFNLGKINNTKNPADTGYNSTGGICGQCSGYISNCYNAGEIVGKQGETGAIAGEKWGNSSISDSYYLSGAVGVGKGKNDGCKGLSNSEMKSLSGRAGALVDILNATSPGWSIDASKNNGYPFLTSVPVEPTDPVGPPDSNEELTEDNAFVFTEDANIYVQSLNPVEVKVYAVGGQKISVVRIQSGKQHIGIFPSGIYFIQIDGKRAKKIYVQ